jgi:hypothetical protein
MSSRCHLSVVALSICTCVSSLAQPQWTQQNPANSPPARFGHGIVYDEARGQVMLFGGESASGAALADTWIWDGSNWTQKFPANSPPSRYGFGMTYDAARQQVVLFGGATGTGSLLSAYSDTWTWDGDNWTKQNPSTNPPAAYETPIAYDAATQQVIQFGGLYPSNTSTPDQTWAWDGSNWTVVASELNSPNGFYGAALAYDGASQRLVLLEGPSGDTWIWNGTFWMDAEIYEPGVATYPNVRLASMAFDAASGQAVLFGGVSNFTPGDTWGWNGSRWAQQFPSVNPTPRYSHAMAYDEAHRTIVLFGGQTDMVTGTVLQDTWLYSAAAPAQIELTVAPKSSTFGRPVTLTASVTPVSASGVVTFYDGAVMLGSALLAGGVANLTTTLLPVGTTSVRANYNGGGTYPPVSALAAASVAAVPATSWAPAPGSPVPVGLGPFAAVVADFNHDDLADLAVVNAAGQNVTVLLGNGSGGFTSTGPFTTGRGPFSLATGDFNGDGNMDLAVGNSGDNSVTILFGDGRGGFTPASTNPVAVGSAPNTLAVADFNSDGNADLLVANGGNQGFTILLGDGAGGFAAAANPISLASPSNAVTVADINQDGIPDLIFALTNGIEYLYGNGDGTFQLSLSGRTGQGIFGVAVAAINLNGNAFPSAMVLDLLNNRIVILESNGSGVLYDGGRRMSTGSSPESMAVGDFNGDGKPDLAVVTSDDNHVTIYLGDGLGNFTAASGGTLAAGKSPFFVVAADFNGDGRADLGIVNFIGGNTSILLGYQ